MKFLDYVTSKNHGCIYFLSNYDAVLTGKYEAQKKVQFSDLWGWNEVNNHETASGERERSKIHAQYPSISVYYCEEKRRMTFSFQDGSAKLGEDVRF